MIAEAPQYADSTRSSQLRPIPDADLEPEIEPTLTLDRVVASLQILLAARRAARNAA